MNITNNEIEIFTQYLIYGIFFMNIIVVFALLIPYSFYDKDAHDYDIVNIIIKKAVDKCNIPFICLIAICIPAFILAKIIIILLKFIEN